MTHVPDKIPSLPEMVAIRDQMVEDLHARNKITDRLRGYAHRFDFHLQIPYENDAKDKIPQIDLGFWKWVLEHTGIFAAMTEKAKREYLDRLEKKPPAFTLKALADLGQNADRIYSEGFEQTIAEVRRVFLGSNYAGQDWRDKKVDNLQRIEKQFRCRGPIYWDTIMQKFYIREGGKFEDLLTACHLLDSRPRPNAAEKFYAIAYDKIREGVNPIVTPYFSVKYHKNGNHLTTWNPEKEEILDRLNSWGLDGSALGDAMKKRYKPGHFADGGFDISQAGEKFDPGPDLQFFWTPEALVGILLDLADLRPGLRCLEPESGMGHIARPMMERVRDAAGLGRVQCFELDYDRALGLGGEEIPGLTVERNDFLKVKPEEWAPFDRIVMNPPFSRQADAIHVLHAMRFLAPDGGLVAVMAAGIESSQTRTAKALREALMARGGYFRTNPAGTFKAAGTLVRTVTLVIPPKNGR